MDLISNTCFPLPYIYNDIIPLPLFPGNNVPLRTYKNED